MAKLGDFIESKGQDVDLIIQEVSLMKQLIKETSHPLSLLRELISNSGSREVGATEIKIKYTVSDVCTALLTTWGSGSESFRCWLQLMHCVYLLTKSMYFVQG